MGAACQRLNDLSRARERERERERKERKEGDFGVIRGRLAFSSRKEEPTCSLAWWGRVRMCSLHPSEAQLYCFPFFLVRLYEPSPHSIFLPLSLSLVYFDFASRRSETLLSILSFFFFGTCFADFHFFCFCFVLL